MYTCPSPGCGSADADGKARCNKCGADLSVLQCLSAVPDAWFNRGLKALEEGEPGRALEWLAACCTANPADAVALRALAKVWAQLGRYDDASRALERSADTEPGAPELDALRDALTTARAGSESTKGASAKKHGSGKKKRGSGKKKRGRKRNTSSGKKR